MILTYLIFSRFNIHTNQFEHWETVLVNAPLHVEFSVLPTDELVLYVLTDSVTEPLIVYQYEGISGFKKKIVASGLSKSNNMRQYTTKTDQHFVLLKSDNEITIIQGVFKGEKYGFT